MGAKEKVILEDTDLVFDKNGTQLYKGVEDKNNNLNNVPLESRALVTEQQLNYLAKDIRDYLDDQNYVAYYEQNPTENEQTNAMNNVFPNGVLTARLDSLIKSRIAQAEGISTYNNGDLKITDIFSGSKKIIYLTPEAKIGEYGIPIVSEFFRDITDDEVIYRKATYEDVLKQNSDWYSSYKSILDESKQSGEKFNCDITRNKNKYRFADFVRVAPDGTSEKAKSKRNLLNGLYGGQTGGSVPAFAEYSPY